MHTCVAGLPAFLPSNWNDSVLVATAAKNSASYSFDLLCTQSITEAALMKGSFLLSVSLCQVAESLSWYRMKLKGYMDTVYPAVLGS